MARGEQGSGRSGPASLRGPGTPCEVKAGQTRHERPSRSIPNRAYLRAEMAAAGIVTRSRRVSRLDPNHAQPA
jgi:hypothetical protein